MAAMNLDHGSHHAVSVLGVANARGEPALCVVIDSTWTVGDEACRLLDAQPEIDLEGSWHGEPGASTPWDPPPSPVPKAGCDVVLRGHALAPTDLVELRVGPVGTELRIVGPRTWQRRLLGLRPSEPAPWERIPLWWEHAAGGPANPLGRGPAAEGMPLPCLESPNDPQRPVGVAWTLPAFAHRRGRDAFDPRGANAAAPDLIAAALRGDEAVLVSGCTARPWTFRLPNPATPLVRIAHHHGDLRPTAKLDGVLLDADARTVRLTWRAWILVGGHELVSAVAVR